MHPWAFWVQPSRQFYRQVQEEEPSIRAKEGRNRFLVSIFISTENVSSRSTSLASWGYLCLFFMWLPQRLWSVWLSDLIGHTGALWLSITSVPPSYHPLIVLRHQESPLWHAGPGQMTTLLSKSLFSLRSLASCQAWRSERDSCPRARHSAKDRAAGWMPEM